MHEEGYYIINNYGSNGVIAPLDSMIFTKTGSISNTLAMSDGGMHIHKRSSNSYSDPFTEVIKSNISLAAGNLGTLVAADASPITGFSQFIINREQYPLAHPTIKLVPVSKQNEQLHGARVCLYILIAISKDCYFLY